MSGARNERATRSVSASVGMRAPVPGFALVLALALVFSPAASGARALAAAPAQAEPGTPGSPAGSPETLVAELSRRAMEDSDDPAAWAELARGLALLRPEGWKDFPTAAERAALRVADSLAAATPGALKELRVEPRDGRTEVAVRVTGPVSYRLFRRLADPVDPRLTLEIADGSPGLLESLYPGLDRGGVRELRVVTTDEGAVRVVIALESGDRGFGIDERDGEIVVRIDDPDAAFTPWRSRPAWARGEPLPIDALTSGGLVGAGTTGAAVGEARRASAGAPNALHALNGWAAEAREATARIVAVAAGRTGGWEPIALAALATLILAGLAARGVVARGRRARVTEPGERTAPRTPGAGEASVPSAYALAARGSSVAEIAKLTGLSRDAALLIARAGERAAERSETGTFFRHAAGRRAARAATMG